MLEYAYGYNDVVAPFVAQLIPHCRSGFGPNVMTLGVIRDGLLIAGLVYHNWDPDAGTIEISGAALPDAEWLSRETIRHMYQYPFLYLDCQMVAQRTPADDERLLGMLARYGYTFIPFPRLFGRERDGVICHLTREAWESNKFNRRLKHHLVQQLEEAA